MLRPFTPTRCLVLLACVSCLLIFTLVPRYDLLDTPEKHYVVPRQFPGLAPGPDKGAPGGQEAGASSTASTASSTAASSTTSAPPSAASSSTAPSSTPPPAADQSSTTSSAPPSTSSTPPAAQPSPSSPTPPPAQAKPTSTSLVTSALVSTNDQGQSITIIVTVPAAVPSSSNSASPSPGADQDDSSSKGVSTSTIVGLSVAGGIAFIGIVAFIVWKFTRKRFSDDFDDSEAIKWPELNAHGDDPHALAANPTRPAGFETNSEVNLTRPDSRAGSYAPSAAASAVDLYPAQDPYAVPPLPHLNPNQPYRDDPGGSFYDPYSGPVPQTFADGDSIAGGEAIPMTQINRSRSPAPPMGYDAGRRSPGPQMAYDAGRRSPGPQAAFMGPETGRSSPAPRAMSPGPGMALAGRASPGPQAAYGYGGGAPPPGLHPGY